MTREEPTKTPVRKSRPLLQRLSMLGAIGVALVIVAHYLKLFF